MKALDFIKYAENNAHVTFRSVTNPGKTASNSEVRRWLDQGTFTINGTKPKADDEITFPVEQFVYAYGKKNQITIVGESPWPSGRPKISKDWKVTYESDTR